MFRIALGGASCALLLPCLLLAQPPLVLRDGTPVRLRLSRSISSAEAKPGDSADLEVQEDVKVGETVVILRGGMASVKIVEAPPRKRNRGSKLEVAIDYVRLVNQEKIALRAVKDPKASRAAAAFARFPHGEEFTIAEGAEITAYVNGDVTLDPAKLLARTDAAESAAAESQPRDSLAPAPAPLPAPIGNEDIIAMKQAGISDDLVILKIKFGPGTYQTGTEDMIALKQANVSELVVQAMLAAAAPPPPPPAETAPAAAPEPPRKGLLGKLKVAMLGTPDAWSNKPQAHPASPPESPIPPQLALCPVTILSTPADAAILVDGYPAGRTPAVVKLQPGTYKVTLQATGFPAYTQQIVVEAGQVRSFGVALDSSK